MSPGSLKIGQVIREAREDAEMSQSELADRLGVSQPTLSDVELGKKSLGLDLLDALEEVLGISVTYT